MLKFIRVEKLKPDLEKYLHFIQYAPSDDNIVYNYYTHDKWCSSWIEKKMVFLLENFGEWRLIQFVLNDSKFTQRPKRWLCRIK